MPKYRMESFREFEAIVEMGRKTAERTFENLARERPDKLPPTPEHAHAADEAAGPASSSRRKAGPKARPR
jgi:hypothetical protein